MLAMNMITSCVLTIGTLITYLLIAYTIYLVAKKEHRQNAYLSWIPIANEYLIIKMGGGNPNIMFLYLLGIIPFLRPIVIFLISVYVFLMFLLICRRYNIGLFWLIVSIFIPIAILIPTIKLYFTISKEEVLQN